MSYRLATLLLGIVIAFYWWRVIRMAIKARRRMGRGANFLPPERVGRALRIIWIPVVAIWIGQPLVIAAGGVHAAMLRPLWASAWVGWPAALIAAAGVRLSIACWKAMGRSWRMGIDPAEQNPLIDSGPFAYVRHPIYALSQGMMLASAAAALTPLMMAAALLHVVLLQWEARREEGHMLAVHGQRYASYRDRVGRFLPAISRQP